MSKLLLEEYKRTQLPLYTLTTSKQIGKVVLEAAQISTNMTNMVGDLPSPIPQNVKGGKGQFLSLCMCKRYVPSSFVSLASLKQQLLAYDVVQTFWQVASKP